MHEKPQLNKKESTLENKEVFIDTLKIDSEVNPTIGFSELIQKRKENDLVEIERLTKELKGTRLIEEKPSVEKDFSSKEIAQRISDERDIHKLGQEQQRQTERYNVSPEEQGILAWEDKARKAQQTNDIAESRLALEETEFKEMFGELADTMKESIPRTIEENRKHIEEYTSIAKGLREKKNE